jgi:hypothetical protein
MVLHHQPPLGAAEAEREATKASALVEHGADHAGGYSTTRVTAEDKALRESGLRAEHVAFSFMKRRVQLLMVRDTLGYQYTGDDDTSRMPSTEVDDDDIVERLGRIFKDMPPYTPCPVPEYSADRPPNKVGSRTYVFEYSLHCRSRGHPNSLMQDDLTKFVSNLTSPPQLVDIPEEGKGKGKENREVGEGDDTVTIEDTSDEEDGETLQERFQLWSRFSRPGLPHIPLVEDPPTSLEASLPAPPRRPRNVARKRVAKKLKVIETTSQEVSSSSRVVEYLS